MKLFQWPGKIGAAARSVQQEEGQTRPLPGRALAALVALPSSSGAPPQQAFAEVARAHEPAMRAVALRLCRSQSDAHDLVQDALERALKSYARLPEGSNARAWLISILRNRFIDSCRRSVREKLDEGVTLEALPAPEEQEAAPGWASITTDDLAAAVDKLSEEFRVVYQLHALQGRSYNEIAARLGIPKATVGTRLIRARRKLRDLLLPLAEPREDEP